MWPPVDATNCLCEGWNAASKNKPARWPCLSRCQPPMITGRKFILHSFKKKKKLTCVKEIYIIFWQWQDWRYHNVQNYGTRVCVMCWTWCIERTRIEKSVSDRLFACFTFQKQKQKTSAIEAQDENERCKIIYKSYITHFSHLFI